MAHKHQSHTHKHHHHHQDGHHRHEKKAQANEKQEKQEKIAPKDDIKDKKKNDNATWSNIVMDDSGNFAWQAIQLPNGEYTYQILGRSAYRNMSNPRYSNATHCSTINGSYAMRPLEAVNYPVAQQVAVNAQRRESNSGHSATYTNQEDRTVTPPETEEPAGRELVLVRHTDDNDAELRPTHKKPSKTPKDKSSTRKQPSKRSGDRKPHKPKKDRSMEVFVDRGAQSRLKVNDWIRQNEEFARSQ